jgi:hypothetical protein
MQAMPGGMNDDNTKPIKEIDYLVSGGWGFEGDVEVLRQLGFLVIFMRIFSIFSRAFLCLASKMA